MTEKADKTALVCLWIREHFPLARIENQGQAADTEVWLLVSESGAQAEIDLNRRTLLPPIDTVDWFFSHAEKPHHDETRVLIKANISDPDYFDKLRKALEAGGLTYEERQT